MADDRWGHLGSRGIGSSRTPDANRLPWCCFVYVNFPGDFCSDPSLAPRASLRGRGRFQAAPHDTHLFQITCHQLFVQQHLPLWGFSVSCRHSSAVAGLFLFVCLESYLMRTTSVHFLRMNHFFLLLGRGSLPFHTWRTTLWNDLQHLTTTGGFCSSEPALDRYRLTSLLCSTGTEDSLAVHTVILVTVKNMHVFNKCSFLFIFKIIHVMMDFFCGVCECVEKFLWLILTLNIKWSTEITSLRALYKYIPVSSDWWFHWSGNKTSYCDSLWTRWGDLGQD